MIVNQEHAKKANTTPETTHRNKELFLDSADQSTFFNRHFTNFNNVSISATENNCHLDTTVFKKYKKTFFEDWIVPEQV
ncbi:hypothetical protein [Candidatus Enterococcus courvalinii]|uniref:Uncharacterized protein n=1 Tax=Candidatus Enterococcus courvalinii TaxID=2815329 RepID=A0ABS3HXC9_9ENTE|nr:hypothetical protein [Enterococcus sp. MSG2901]MBO0481128.1 hypothetical protein [Enterococcus sp. MSG2901]